jgi:hypothetical protein
MFWTLFRTEREGSSTEPLGGTRPIAFLHGHSVRPSVDKELEQWCGEMAGLQHFFWNVTSGAPSASGWGNDTTARWDRGLWSVSDACQGTG